MGIEVKIIADSISEAGARITTFQLKYQRFFHSELMTHRMLSRNASSSRAIPVSKVIDQVWNDPAMPTFWGMNKAGMQATKEISPLKRKLAKFIWRTSGKLACVGAWSMMKLGTHKQIANRILEPWQYIHVVVTATDWDNFFKLRNHKDAQPEFRELAAMMQKAMNESTPKVLKSGEWHLPYITDEELEHFSVNSVEGCLPLISAARCARVSYMKHDGKAPSIGEDLELYNQLMTRPYTDKRGNFYGKDDPVHASPVEHQAIPNDDPNEYSGNFRGWIQHRKMIEAQ